MHRNKTPSNNYCCKLMINFSFSFLKNLINFDFVEMKHENYFTSSIQVF